MKLPRGYHPQSLIKYMILSKKETGTIDGIIRSICDILKGDKGFIGIELIKSLQP